MRPMTSLRTMTIPAVLLVTVVVGADYEMVRWTVDGGGVMRNNDGHFELSGTAGQPDAGVMSGGVFTLAGGFWFESPPDDCNDTGNVELYDHQDFIACFTGPDPAGPMIWECACFDLDGDGDIDLIDAARLQQSFTGG